MATMEKSRSRYLQELLDEKDPEVRGDWLAMRSHAQCAQVLSEWANDPRLLASDIVSLPSPFDVMLEQFVVGNGRKNIVGTNPVFYLGPNEEWEPKQKWGEKVCLAMESSPPMIPLGYKRRRGGKMVRQFMKLPTPQACPAAEAISILKTYGPDSEHPMHKNRIKEYSIQQFTDLKAGEQQRKLQQDLNRRNAELAKAEAEASNAKGLLAEMEARLAKLEAATVSSSKKGKR